MLTIVLLCLGLILMIAVFKWKEVYSFFQPNRFLSIFFINPDNTISNYLMFKKDMSISKFNNSTKTYFLSNKPEVTYLDGKVKSYFFRRDSSIPINLLKDSKTLDPGLIDSFVASKTTDLWKAQDRPLDNFVKEYGLYIGIAIIVMVAIYYLFFARTGGG